MTTAPLLIRYFHPSGGIRHGLLRAGKIYDVSAAVPSLADWFRHSCGRVNEAIAALSQAADSAADSFAAGDLDAAPAADAAHWLPPLDEQEVWAAGVTYVQSRAARQEESTDGGDVYARVYDAQRPEIFYKASAKNTVGHLDEVGIRSDSLWNVPEPELGLVLNPAMEMLGFTIGNDMSSRDIEGANPLYLPQAKVYNASCALGPGILLMPAAEWLATKIHLTIRRADRDIFSGSISTAKIKRSLAELVDYLGRSSHYPHGVILLTGTGIVPPPDFTLQPGDITTIRIDAIGSLQNRVKQV